MKNAAAKGGKLFFLAAAFALCAALLAAPAAEATRTLPALPEPAQATPRATLEVLEDATPDPHRNAEKRLRLFEDLSWPTHPLEGVQISKTASGGFDLGLDCNILEKGGLSQDCGSPSFQGLWHDPTTGLAYARNRWYDARTASWLSEDPLGPVDSPNLYAGFAWMPHAVTDPLGEDVIKTPGGNYSVIYPDGSGRHFTAAQVEQNPAAFLVAVVEGAGGDWDKAEHDLLVAELNFAFNEKYGRWPDASDSVFYNYRTGTEIYADGWVTHDGIEKDYTVEVIALSIVTAGTSAAAVRAGGASLGRTAGAFTASLGDDVAGEVFGLNPSAIRSLLRLRSLRLKGKPKEGAVAGTLGDFIPVKFDNGRTYALLPSNGGTGPRRWHRVRPPASGVDPIERHHPIARFLGGHGSQDLIDLPRSVHKDFHRFLQQELANQGIPLSVGRSGGSTVDWLNYMRVYPGTQKKAFDAILAASRRVDALHGTSVTSSVWQNIYRGDGAFTALP